MTPSSKSSVDERPRDLRVLVHFADEGPDLRLGERPHAVAENGLVLGENGEGLGVFDGVFGHRSSSRLAERQCYHCRSEPADASGRLNSWTGVLCDSPHSSAVGLARGAALWRRASVGASGAAAGSAAARADAASRQRAARAAAPRRNDQQDQQPLRASGPGSTTSASTPSSPIGRAIRSST